MNAVAPAILRGASVIRQAVPNLQPTGDVADPDVPNGDVGDLAGGAYVPSALCLVLRPQQNGKAGLREPAPAVFEEVAFENDPLRVLELKQVLGDERTTVDAANESRLTLHPDHGLEQVVVADFDIRGREGGFASAHHDALAGGLEIIVDDLERAHGV